jgi:hypothetical protein
LTDAGGNRVQELAWVGSGGGTSEVENPGFWQTDSNPGQDAEFVTGGRAVPDISLDADPNFFTAANPQPVPGLTDITVGNNGLWPALPGYDEVTGLGAPDIAKLAVALC